MTDLTTVLIDVAESLEEGVAIFAPDGRSLYCNPAYRSIATAVRDAGPGAERLVEPGRRVRVHRRRTAGGLTVVTVVDVREPRPLKVAA
jgi:hypothetical protein